MDIQKGFVALFVFFFSIAALANCDPYFIVNMTPDKQVITLDSGTVWGVYGVNNEPMDYWRIGDEVMMCYGHMINKVQEDTQVSVAYLGKYGCDHPVKNCPRCHCWGFY